MFLSGPELKNEALLYYGEHLGMLMVPKQHPKNVLCLLFIQKKNNALPGT